MNPLRAFWRWLRSLWQRREVKQEPSNGDDFPGDLGSKTSVFLNHFNSIWRRLRSLWRRRQAKQEIDEELRFHLEQCTAESIAAGMSREDAEREARKRFGNLQNVREECREVRGIHWVDNFTQDVRFGFRVLIKQPFALVAAMTALALGIGLVTLMFCFINGSLLRGVPLPEADRLVSTTVPAWAFRDFSEQQTTFEGLVSFSAFHAKFRAAGATSRRSVCFTTANFLMCCVRNRFSVAHFVLATTSPARNPSRC